MADFSMETAMKVIPNYMGDFKELDSFLKIIELIYNSLNENGKKQLIEVAYHIKLSPKVKTILGHSNEPVDFVTFSTLLRNKFKSTRTIPQLHNILTNLVQGNQTIKNFSDKLMNTIAELNRLQIQNLNPNATNEEKKVVEKINETYALNIFKNGLNDQFRHTIFASQPKTLSEAINLSSELEQSNQLSVMHFRTHNISNSRNFNNTYNGQNNRNFPPTEGNFNGNNRGIRNNQNYNNRNHNQYRYNSNYNQNRNPNNNYQNRNPNGNHQNNYNRSNSQNFNRRHYNSNPQNIHIVQDQRNQEHLEQNNYNNFQNQGNQEGSGYGYNSIPDSQN